MDEGIVNILRWCGYGFKVKSTTDGCYVAGFYGVKRFRGDVCARIDTAISSAARKVMKGDCAAAYAVALHATGGCSDWHKEIKEAREAQARKGGA